MSNNFEGPEKRLELYFSSNISFITHTQWSNLLKNTNCRIINVIHNPHVTMYLLSESSLIVFQDRCILKTCGTTQPLKIIPHLNNIIQPFNICIVRLIYSHRHFIFPDNQLPPYNNFACEQEYVKTIPIRHVMTIELINRWYCIILSDIDTPYYPFIELSMTQLDSTVMKHFYMGENGLSLIVPLTLNKCQYRDPYNFDPCGLSMNEIDDRCYSTLHITPEDGFSYVSYETNDMIPSSSWVNTLNPKSFYIVSLNKDRDDVSCRTCNHTSIFKISDLDVLTISDYT